MTRQRWIWVQDRTDPVVKRQKGARYTILIAICLDAIAGVLYAVFEHVSVVVGLYWAEEEATTVGSGLEPHTAAGQIIKAAVGITVIPLFAATFSIFTTALTATHVHKVERSLSAHVLDGEKRIKEHVEGRLVHHLGGNNE